MTYVKANGGSRSKYDAVYNSFDALLHLGGLRLKELGLIIIIDFSVLLDTTGASFALAIGPRAARSAGLSSIQAILPVTILHGRQFRPPRAFQLKLKQKRSSYSDDGDLRLHRARPRLRQGKTQRDQEHRHRQRLRPRPRAHQPR